MSNKIFKNYQVNVGMPFQVRAPLNFNTIKTVGPPKEYGSEASAEEGTDEVSGGNYGEITDTAREEARIIVREAEQEAERFLEEAQREAAGRAAAIEEDARKRGYEAGINEARQQYEDLIQEAEFIKEHARTEYKEVLTGIEKDAIGLILDIARKVISDEIEFNKESVICLIRQAIEKCTNKEDITVKLSPKDHEYVSGNMEELASRTIGLGEVQLKRDASMKPGDCVIETPYGCIDAGVDTKLKKIEEEFMDAVDRE